MNWWLKRMEKKEKYDHSFRFTTQNNIGVSVKLNQSLIMKLSLEHKTLYDILYIERVINLGS